MALALILIGILVALTVHYALGLACVVIGIVLLLWPAISGSVNRSP